MGDAPGTTPVGMGRDGSGATGNFSLQRFPTVLLLKQSQCISNVGLRLLGVPARKRPNGRPVVGNEDCPGSQSGFELSPPILYLAGCEARNSTYLRCS